MPTVHKVPSLKGSYYNQISVYWIIEGIDCPGWRSFSTPSNHWIGSKGPGQELYCFEAFGVSRYQAKPAIEGLDSQLNLYTLIRLSSNCCERAGQKLVIL